MPPIGSKMGKIQLFIGILCYFLMIYIPIHVILVVRVALLYKQERRKVKDLNL